MAIQLKNTKDYHLNGVKILCHGLAGAGKTTLIKTLPNPIVLSAESGLLSLADSELPYIEINNMDDLMEAYTWAIESAEAKNFESIAIDSISEIAEVVLTDAKLTNKDGRAAYGELATTMQEMIRSFRDIKGKHVYFSAKQEKTLDEAGKMTYACAMPGVKLSQGLPFYFDEVFALRLERDGDNNIQRALMCQPDGIYSCKDRSGKLDIWELPDLGEIIKKIGGSV
jgi:phage nucleotide-binding protein